MPTLPGLALCPVPLPRAHLVAMIRVVRGLFAVSQLPEYRRRVSPWLMDIAHHDPGHDAVMMGYDFHLGAEGPRLIEVNTNAGGGLLAYRASYPERPPTEEEDVQEVRVRSALLDSFAKEIKRFSGGTKARPQVVAIIDENPGAQFLFPEMEAMAALFEKWGAASAVVDPQALIASADGVFLNGQAVDLIYNRHCDFYLEQPEMAPLRAAYLARRVCLTPNPRAYGLLADKRRLVSFCDADFLQSVGLPAKRAKNLAMGVPKSQLLSEMGLAEAWAQRKHLVFKPVTHFGSRGVLLGASISRSRFNAMPAEMTLAQELVAPSYTPCELQEEAMKTDFRLFVYRNQVLGVAARLYRGQVTNFREPGSGYAPVRIV